MDLKSISAFLQEQIEAYRVRPISYHRGFVTRVGDGVVRVEGLPGRQYGELLEFDGGVFGMALDLTENGVGAVLFDAADTVRVGCGVRGMGSTQSSKYF